MTRAEIEVASKVTRGEPTFEALVRLMQLQIGLLLDIRDALAPRKRGRPRKETL